MSWVDLKDYNHPVMEDSEAIAFFASRDDAEAFCEWKRQQPNPNKNDYEVGEYVDFDFEVQIRGS